MGRGIVHAGREPRRRRSPGFLRERGLAPASAASMGGSMKNDDKSVRDPFKVNSLVLGPDVDPCAGTVRWAPARSLWNGAMLLAAVVLGPLAFTWDAFLVFLILSAATLCAGHSVGFHRRLIHRSFQCPKWVERTLVWMGTAVGMGGPLWTIRTHDTRDWAQRQP